MNRVVSIVSAVAAAMVLGRSIGSSVNTVPLSEMERAAVHEALAVRHLADPVSIVLSATAFVDADYEIADLSIARDHETLRRFGEEHLLAIREAMLPFGFEDYRVNLRNRLPGSDGAQRLGSVRSIDCGDVEWVRP